MGGQISTDRPGPTFVLSSRCRQGRDARWPLRATTLAGTVDTPPGAMADSVSGDAWSPRLPSESLGGNPLHRHRVQYVDLTLSD